MKHIRTLVSAGILAAAVAGLQASGPVGSVGELPLAEPGPWTEPDAGAGASVELIMHAPDFSAVIPRTRKMAKPLPVTVDRGMPQGLHPMQSSAPSTRSRGGDDSGADGRADSGILDSWLLPQDEAGTEASGWGWLADSVAEGPPLASGSTAELLRGARLDAAAEVFRLQRLDIMGPDRMDMDLSRGALLMEDVLSGPDPETRATPGSDAGADQGWSMPSWR